MKRLVSASVMLVTMLLIPPISEAKGGKCGLEVLHSGRDPVVERFALVLKERIAASSRYRFVEGNEAAAAQIVMTSVDGEGQVPIGRISSIAVMLSYAVKGAACSPNRPRGARGWERASYRAGRAPLSEARRARAGVSVCV